MDNIISELWFNGIVPQDMCRSDEDIKKLWSIIKNNEEMLKEKLTEEQNKLFKEIQENNQNLESIMEEKIFTLGFKLGMKIAVESLYEEKKNE